MLDGSRAVGVHLNVRAGEMIREAPPRVMTTRREAWFERDKAELIRVLQPEPGADDPAERHNWISASSIAATGCSTRDTSSLTPSRA